MHLRPSLATLVPLAICLLCPPAALAEDEETVSVYLPFYSEKWWSDMHGSVISEDADKTEYTIFCPTQTPQRCNLAGDTPFTFTEGPETLIFHATQSKTYIMNLECDLEAQTAATCSGYSSLKDDYVAGTFTGPTEIKWTSTFTGSDVVWAPITLADEAPARTGGALEDITATAMETPEETAEGEVPEDSMVPGADEGAAAGGRAGRWAAVAVGMGMAAVGAVL